MLFGILLLGLALRVVFPYGLPIIADEPLYIYRSIGWIDQLGTASQKTPLDMLSAAPWWTFLSFHDHPPLSFLIEHIFYRFGDATILWFARTPSIIMGVLSVALVYMLGKEMGNKRVGSMAALLFGVNCLAVFFGRVAMMESFATVFILLSLICLYRALKRPKYLLLAGVSLGLAFLTKYTAIIVLPVFAFFVSLHKKEFFKQKYIYVGIALTAIICLPLIIYNYHLFQLTGHFDVQIATLLHQETPEWQVLLGKEQRGNISQRILGIGDFAHFVSPIFLSLSLVSGAFLAWNMWHRQTRKDAYIFLCVLLISLVLIILLTGSASRFLYYFVPFLCIAIAFALEPLLAWKRIGYGIIAIFLCAEIAYTVNTFVYPTPWGKGNITYALGLRKQDDGIEFLDARISELLAGKRSADHLRAKNSRLQYIIDTYSARRVGTPEKIRLVMDSRLNITATVWIFLRRMSYEGWPLVPYQDMAALLKLPLLRPEDDATYIYVATANAGIRNRGGVFSGESPEEFEYRLIQKGIAPEDIQNRAGKTVYRIYVFTGRDAVHGQVRVK